MTEIIERHGCGARRPDRRQTNRTERYARFARAAVLLLFTAFAAVFAANGARAALEIDITQGYVAPLPIAIADLYSGEPTTAQVGKDISSVVSADLERSGLFKPIDQRAFLQDASGLQATPNYSSWRKINAQALVTGRVETLPDGRLNVQFRLWDVFAEQYMVGVQYTTPPQNWRLAAHLIADQIYKRLTGEDGYFATRIVYVAESGPADRRIKRLAIMDQDGANHQFLTSGESLVLTPRFSPTQQEITYLSYVNNRPRVYLYNIDTGQQEVLGDFPGMTFAPRFSPTGNRVTMSLAENGNTDIYVMDLRTRRSKRLTSHPSIDTSPSYAPDGDRLVFNSDRSGRQHLYVMNDDGSDVKRITFSSGSYATPVWSPRGDLIAFTKISGGKFSIGVMRPDGSGERILTEGFHNEGPTWAPNGRVLMFWRKIPGSDGRGDRTELWSVDLTGYNEREIITPGQASDPAWSPLYRLIQ
jgi:TolB protein